MSTRLNALRAKRGDVVDKMEALLAGAEAETRDLTDAEKDAYGDLEKDCDRIDEALKVEERLEARKAAQAKPVPGQAAVRTVPAAARLRTGKLKAFTGPDAEENAYRSGQWALAAVLGNEKSLAWCRDNGVAIVKAQSEGVNSGGGFLVPTEFSQAIIDLRETYGTFRQYCQVVPMGSDSITIPRRSGGVTAYWVGEGSQITESQKSWDQVQLVARKLGALTRMSTELAEDAVISIADDLANEMAYAFAKAEDAAGFNGDGTTTYGGMTGIRKIFADNVSSYVGAVDAASGHDTFAEIDATDLVTVMSKLPKYAEPNARWYCSQVAWNLVFQRLTAAAGGTSMMDLTGAKPQRSYLGYPVVIDQTMPTATTDISDTAMILFGDLRAAVSLGERRGFTLKRSEDRYFEYDQIGLMATERVCIVVHDLGDTSNAGPVVALMGE